MSDFHYFTEASTVLDLFKDVITGPSAGGLGAEVAINLAHGNPAHLVLVGRSESKIKPVQDKIATSAPSVKTSFVQCDLDDVVSAKAAADGILGIAPSIDVLINSAGVMALRNRELSRQGVEKQFATNHLGHFVLTNRLLDGLLKSPHPRVICVTSEGYRIEGVNFEDPSFEKRKYSAWLGYGQSKTANILHAFALGRRYQDKGLIAAAVHPGLVAGTQLQSNSGVDHELFAEALELSKERNGGVPIVMPENKTLSQGAASILVGALSTDLKNKSPVYIADCQVQEAESFATDPENCDRLWTLSEELQTRGSS